MDDLKIADLQYMNGIRDQMWDPNKQITIEFRGTELAGEAGEACNIMKKLARERMGLKGSRATEQELLDELADTVICCALAANHIRGDLAAAIRRKFNETSTKQGFDACR